MKLSLPTILLLATFFNSCIAVPRGNDCDEECHVRSVDSFLATAEPPAPVDDDLSDRVAAPVPVPDWVKQIASSGSARPLPAATTGISFAPDQQPNLAQLLGMWSQVTGVETIVDHEMERVLASTDAALPASRSIAASNVHSFVQVQLERSNCYLVRIGGVDSNLVSAVSASGRSAAGLRSSAVFVHSRDLVDFEDQHAFLIQIVIDLPGLDTRQLSTSLRSLLTDTNTQNLISAGSHSMVLQGTGANVLQIARALAAVSQLDHLARESMTQEG